jgi:hypothetical protein
MAPVPIVNGESIRVVEEIRARFPAESTDQVVRLIGLSRAPTGARM